MPDYNWEYRFVVFSRRWGHSDSYRMKLTQTGWDIAHIAINGPSDKTGEPILFMNFRQDYIQYPYDIGRFLEHIWERAHDCDENLSNEEIQAMLDALADWVTLTERSAPVALIYNE